MKVKTLAYKEVFDFSPGMLLALDTDFFVIAANHSFLVRTNYTLEDIIGRSIFEIFPENFHDELRGSLQLVLKNRVISMMELHRFDPGTAGRDSESEKSWRIRQSPVPGADGNTDCIVQGFEEITGLTGLENKCVDLEKRNEELQHLTDKLYRALNESNDLLAKKTIDLQKATEELGEFAATAAHDIRAPFRNISNYIDILKSRFDQKKPEGSEEFFERIAEARNKITLLSDALSRFSTTIRSTEALAKTDMNLITEQALQEMETVFQKTQAEVTVEKNLPDVLGKPVQIKELIKNLLSNAIKFTKETNPVVKITYRPVKNMAEFCVSDNGVGVEEKYREKIFGIFQRLHGQDEFPGSGLGLSICRKIVQMHGGRIWVESEPEKGSKFFFTLPLYKE